jgi:hypothetical protein
VEYAGGDDQHVQRRQSPDIFISIGIMLSLFSPLTVLFLDIRVLLVSTMIPTQRLAAKHYHVVGVAPGLGITTCLPKGHGMSPKSHDISVCCRVLLDLHVT